MALLTATQIRTHVDSDLPDTALDAIIAAEEAEIVRLYGPNGTGAMTGHYTPEPGATILTLDRKASAVTSVVERTSDEVDTLDTASFRLEDDGRTLRRVIDGDDGNTYWAERVDVTFTVTDDDARRIMALVDLVKLRLAFSGHGAIGVGKATITAADHARERARILRTAGNSGVFA